MSLQAGLQVTAVTFQCRKGAPTLLTLTHWQNGRTVRLSLHMVSLIRRFRHSVTTSKALVTTSVALVTTSKALVTTSSDLLINQIVRPCAISRIVEQKDHKDQ